MNAAFLISLSVPLAFVGMSLLEPRLARRDFVEVPGWKRIGFAFFVVALVLGSLVPVALEAVGLTRFHAFDLHNQGWWAFPIGFGLATLANYGWHRAVHRFDVLWRTTHQLHHSPRRVDLAGAFFSHPLEVVAKTVISILVGTVGLGLAPAVASAVSSTVVVLTVFQHWNIKTPRVLGYVIPRPEMHALHHESEVHARNYSEFPLWDMVFGSYSNPERFNGEVGFPRKASERIADMLLARDVLASDSVENDGSGHGAASTQHQSTRSFG